VTGNILWKFFCYRDDRGKNVVGDWLVTEVKSKKAQQNLRRTLEHLSMKEKDAWKKPQASGGLGNHIYVIRFKDENGTQWRIYGGHDDDRKCFVLTNYGTERGGKYIPPVGDCVALAARRMDVVREQWNQRILPLPRPGNVIVSTCAPHRVTP
jgi:hypothetical protein